jgi:acetyl esterase/lipase
MRRALSAGALLSIAVCSCGGTVTTTLTQRSTKTVTVAPAARVYFEGVTDAAQRPPDLSLSADGTLAVSDIQWTSWGGR